MAPPLQYACLENPFHSRWGRKESDTTERLHFHFSLSCIGEGNGNPLQCSCLENPGNRGAFWAAVCGVTQSQTQLSDFIFFLSLLFWEFECSRGSAKLSPKGLSLITSSTQGVPDHCSPAAPEIDLFSPKIEMATHSSVLAWRIPGMGESGGLPPMGSHRVRHD